MTEQKLQINLIRAATDGTRERNKEQQEFLAEHYLTGLAELSHSEPFGGLLIDLLYSRVAELIWAASNHKTGISRRTANAFIPLVDRGRYAAQALQGHCQICIKHQTEHDLNGVLACQSLLDAFVDQIRATVQSDDPSDVFLKGRDLWSGFLKANPKYPHRTRYIYSQAQNAGLFKLFRGV